MNAPARRGRDGAVRSTAVDGTVARPAAITVLEGGAFTTVQDIPGRVGYWHVGVPPNGPMDDLSHRLVNRVVGNTEAAAALELTGRGPTLRFDAPAVIALGGAAMPMTVDGRPVDRWVPVTVGAGSVVAIGAVDGPGLRASLAVAGGIDVPPYLGSRSTFTLGAFGGHEGRPLRSGDALRVGDLALDDGGPLPAGLEPHLGARWELGVLVGPHTAPEFLTTDGLAAFLNAVWTVHYNSARTGVRLIGPKPRWARADGGDAGLHPSNIHDTGYALGAVDVTGDMPVILGPDGPSLGGFVCPAVVAASERWKLGQMCPGDTVRLVPWTLDHAAVADRFRADFLRRATDRIEPLARPSWNASPTMRSLRAELDDGILASRAAEGARPAATYRRAGDRFLLVEYGPMTLDIELRLRVHALDNWVTANLGSGVVDATAGVRSLLVQVDGDSLTVAGALSALLAADDELDAVLDAPFPSRIVHLPLSWDDPSTREAIQRYMHGVRPDAPWCPWNIEFIRRINGLGSVDDVYRTVFDASWLTLARGAITVL